MVDKKHEEKEDDIDITTETEKTVPAEEADLVDIEAKETDIIKALKEKLKRSEAEKRDILEEVQRAKADFLNARRRLDEERSRDRERQLEAHIENLLPLCDSFQMAMADKAAWEKIDENWRKGVEGIKGQLQKILDRYNVITIDPQNQPFNPEEHEALSTVMVEEAENNDKVMTVIQAGYAIQREGQEPILIRPARVVIGIYEKK